jgi:hypothetical protein
VFSILDIKKGETMSDFCQRVINLFKNCTKKIIPYALALAATSNRKTYAGIARSLHIEYLELYDSITTCNDYENKILETLCSKVKKYQTRQHPGKIIFDFTRLAKDKDAKTPLTTWDRDGRINKVNNGFSVGFCVWTNGFITIPLSFCFWLNIKDAGDLYQSKKDLAKGIIKITKEQLGDLEVIVDGEFATLEMLEFFAEEKIEFTARIACNRNVISSAGIKAQLRNHEQLRLRKNEKSRTIQASFGNRSYQFTAVKQKTRNGKKKIVFIISTLERTSKEHVKAYALRWRIETFFRTSKQSLGLEDCQAHKLEGITFHILAVMLAYAAIEETKFAKKKKSPELILGILKSKNSHRLFHQYADLVETYATF